VIYLKNVVIFGGDTGMSQILKVLLTMRNNNDNIKELLNYRVKDINNGSSDLIIFSSRSLFTSILPRLMTPEVTENIKKSKAKKLYMCNLITQDGLDAVIANKAKIEKLNELDIKVIADEEYKIEESMIRHASLKTAYLVYSYLMGDK